MKKLKLLGLFSAMMFISTNAFSHMWAFCVNGYAYFVFTDGNGNVTHTWRNGTCSPNGYMWDSAIKVVFGDGTGTDGTPATSTVYSVINTINIATDTTTINSDTIKKYVGTSVTKYYLDPFLLDQDIAELMAADQGISIYGLKILGNPFSTREVHYKVLSDRDQTVTVKVVGISSAFTFTTSVNVTHGLNDLYVNVTGATSGAASFKVGTSNTAKTNISFSF